MTNTDSQNDDSRLARLEAFAAKIAALDTDAMENDGGPDAIEAISDLIDEAKTLVPAKPAVVCPNCTWTGGVEDLSAIPEKGIFERVSPGELMPEGECPECGALCHARHVAVDHHGGLALINVAKTILFGAPR